MILSLENNPTWLNDQPFRPTGVPGVISVALLSGNGFSKALITTVQLVETEAMASHLKLKRHPPDGLWIATEVICSFSYRIEHIHDQSNLCLDLWDLRNMTTFLHFVSSPLNSFWHCFCQLDPWLIRSIWLIRSMVADQIHGSHSW